MAILDIQSSKFSNSSWNVIKSIPITKQQCVKFAIQVGTSHYAATKNPIASLALATYRAAAIRCALDFSSPYAKLRPSSSYGDFEATEKVNVSYWIGMTMAAIAADDVLSAPKTQHASHFGHRLGRANPASKSLADLVGFGSGSLHIIEAKGSQRHPSPKDRKDWKTQAETINAINGSAVASNSYSVALIGSQISVDLVDPKSDRGLDIQMEKAMFGSQYYRPFVSFLDTTQSTFQIRLGSNPVTIRPIAYDPIDNNWIFVGIHQGILKLMKDFNDGKADNAEEKLMDFNLDEAAAGNNWYIGRDGIAVVTGSNPCHAPI